MVKFEEVRQSLVCETASLPFTEYSIDFGSLTKDANIIHLHWLGWHFDYADFFSEMKKPIVWTIHDMNPFLGLFHYRGDAMSNKDSAGKLDETIWKLKSRIIRKYKYPFEIVSPSDWLQSEAAKNRAFNKRVINVIPYPLNLDTFHFRIDSPVREKFGIPSDKTILMAIAESTSNFRKGFDLLIESVKHLDNITLLLIGQTSQNTPVTENVIYAGTVNDDQLLSEYFSIADATVIPSREDNLPNVMLESLACGTPVISFKVGGMSDHIKNFETGILADDISVDSLRSAIEKFVENKDRFDRNLIRRYAEKHFNEKLIAGKYIEVYNRIDR